ncbi:MAG: tetraacyldisaccharide 4'-kinase [Gammaproteobacteria bacterium]|nr:tetraacyldisaccharide 4'-kinase [Gammaproteobacteria bacterium]MCY4229227.1 tetraacyldisaccharide 4'-kinase [Gammaproteobacteria bacterium]
MRNKLQAGWSTPGWINYALLPLSWLYILLHGIKVWMYRTGLKRTARVSVPVIVVGAITAGGSGKTPLVIAIARQLKARGYRPGVITRGYKGQSTRWPRVVKPDTPVLEVGDEALLVRLTADLPVVAGPDRAQDAKVLIEKCNCDVVVSDDGLQHLALYRDLNIAVIDSEFGFGNGWCLPAGPLREPIGGLKRADIKVRNGNYGYKHEGDGHTMDMQIRAIRNLSDRRTVDIADLKNGPVHAVAALGNPERFFMQLEGLGLDIVRHRFADHHFYSAGDLMFDDDLPVLMSEKDAVKCHDLPHTGHLLVAEAEAVVHDDFFREIEIRLDKLT